MCPSGRQRLVSKVPKRKLSMYKDDEQRRFIENAPSMVTVLSLDNMGLTELPAYVLSLKNLRDLDISGNNFDKIPSELINLKNLRVLRARDNKIKEIPIGIEKIGLVWVFLERNRINSIPDEFFMQKSITTLNLSDNYIEKISEAIGEMEKLSELYLSNNRIRSLPQQISCLKNLFTLCVDNNCLTELPFDETWSVPMKKFEQVVFFGNPLLPVPTEAFNMMDHDDFYDCGWCRYFRELKKANL